MKRMIIIINLFLVLGCLIPIRAQTPFTTDDAEVTEEGKYHLEFLNEYDLLQKSLNPSLRQDSAIARFAFGITKRIEIGMDLPTVTIFNSNGTVPRRPMGIGDIGAHFKMKLSEEKEGSKMPAFAVAFALRFPSGNVARSLGSGVTNYLVYGVAQKSLTNKTKLRANAGILFAGNTVIGALGIKTTSGRLFSGGISVVKQYTDKLRLGGELTGVASSNFQLSKGQLQTTLGGNYNLRKNLALDFGLIIGRFPASPRAGVY